MTATYVGEDGIRPAFEEFDTQLISYCAGVRFCRRIDSSVS